MSDLGAFQALVAAILGIFSLAGIGGGIYAFFRSSAADARIKRLQSERDDYLSRLNYIEPRLRSVEQQNDVLMAMYDPSQRLEDLSEDHGELKRNDADLHRRLSAIHDLLVQIDFGLDRPRKLRGPKESEI